MFVHRIYYTQITLEIYHLIFRQSQILLYIFFRINLFFYLNYFSFREFLFCLHMVTKLEFFLKFIYSYNLFRNSNCSTYCHLPFRRKKVESFVTILVQLHNQHNSQENILTIIQVLGLVWEASFFDIVKRFKSQVFSKQCLEEEF